MRVGSTSLKQAALLIYFPSMLMSLGQGMLIPALPKLGAEFSVSEGWAVQALTAQLLGRTLALIPAGVVVDRTGPKPVMLTGATLAAVSGVAAGFAPHFSIVLIAQFFWGVGMGIWMFGREIAAFDMVRTDQRGRQMSMLMGISSTGMAFGPGIGGALTDLIGVRPLFFVYAGTSTVVLLLSLMQRNTVVARGRRQHRAFSLQPIRDIHPYFRITYLILFISTFGQMTRSQVTNSALPLYTQQELGYSATVTGGIFTFIGVVTFLMIVPTGFISDKLGRKWAAAPAAVFSFVGFVLFPFLENVPTLVIGALVIGMANGLAMGAMTIFTYDIVPDHARGQLQAMRRSFGELGAVVSPPIVGALAVTYGASSPFWVFAPLHGISALMLIFWARESLRKKLPPGAPTHEEITADSEARS